MAETIKQHDFVEVEYVGRVQENGMVFDTNIESVAKENGLYQDGMRYSPIIVCVGEGQIMKGIDEFLVGKTTENTYEDVTVPAEDGFGKKSMDKLQMVPMSQFKKQGLRPFQGMQVNIDESYGVVRSVNGGRIIVDFNHPLASKTLLYTVNVGKKVTDQDTQMKEYVSRELNIKAAKVGVNKSQETTTITLPFDLPAQVQPILAEKFNQIFHVTPEFAVQEKTEEKTA